MDQQAIIAWVKHLWQLLLTNMLSLETAIQLGVAVAVFCLGWLIGGIVKKRWLSYGFHGRLPAWLRSVDVIFSHVISPICIWILLFIASFAAHHFWPQNAVNILNATIYLTGAWIVIRLLSAFIQRPDVARWVARIIWIIVALNILGLFSPLLSAMDNIAFETGKTRISLLSVLKTILMLGFVLWAAISLSHLAEKQIRSITSITPSLQVLISKIARVSFITIAILTGLNLVGIDLSTLAIFSGAVGIGLGFGLQKVVSNFISGIILLVDRSIKPGDVIRVDDTYGWVNSLKARHVSVITRDGKEHLIPNELLITEQVENWSYTDSNIRIHIPFGVSYNSNPHQVIDLVVSTVKNSKRILKHQPVVCLLTGFGDSSVDFELRCWINDPQNGIGNIKSDLLLSIWDVLKENNIEIPFPQRDLHVKSIPGTWQNTASSNDSA